MTSRFMMVAVLCAIADMAGADGLAAAAQKEKARRDKNREVGLKVRVITEKDVKTVPSGAAPPPSAGGAESTPQSGAGARTTPETTGTPTGDTEARKARGAELRVQFKAAEIAVREAEAALANAEAQPPGGITVYRNGTTIPAWREADVKQARWELQAAKNRRDSIEDAARHENIPPGYLR
jgi:hypothetical protein